VSRIRKDDDPGKKAYATVKSSSQFVPGKGYDWKHQEGSTDPKSWFFTVICAAT